MKELTQLHYFRVAARLENLTRASEALHVSQPNLSRAIKRLEDDLGVVLFDRTPGKVRLNPYGKAYLDCVDKAFSLLDSGEKKVRDMASGELEARISVACPMQLYMEEMIEAFLKDHPENTLSIQHSQRDAADVDRGLWEGQLDFALTPKSAFSPGIEWTPVFSCSISLLVCQSNPLVSRESVHMRELKNEGFICNNAGINHALTEAICHEAGFTPKIVFESNESAFAGAWIEKARGVSLISAYDLLGLTDRLLATLPLKAIRILDPEPLLEMGIAKQRDRVFKGHLAEFFNYSTNYFVALGRDIDTRCSALWKN